MSETERARAIHRRAITVDGHCDTPYRLHRHSVGLAAEDPSAQVDLDKLRRSGINASFFVSYVPSYYVGRGAYGFAEHLIDLIQREIAANPELLAAASAADIRRAREENRIAILIGIEGGHAIEDSLEKLAKLYERGARYLTLTHVNNNNWADSSGDAPLHGGLTPLGRQIVQRMNDLGMLVDVSHVADSTFSDVLATTRTPVIASHSSCRALTTHPRNLTDEMLRDLAANGGICMINFFSAFISQSVADCLRNAPKGDSKESPVEPELEELPNDRSHWNEYLEWWSSLDCPQATLDDVIAHIVHAVEVAGIDHVGIGTDFDGVPALPQGVTDASMFPAVTERLLRHGFSDADVLKILGENFMRVFEAVEGGRTSV
ncbi:MAG: dipeptidase [Thermoanaerobaculia bacterium]